MKRCFTFDNSKDCKLILNYLQTIITAPIHVQLGNAIIVADGAYPKAILEGKKYAIVYKNVYYGGETHGGRS